MDFAVLQAVNSALGLDMTIMGENREHVIT